MGQSTPTTTMALDTFQKRYSEFRAELHPSEQRIFDQLVEQARRHSSAINRRPHLDFERPVMLSMLMGAMQELRQTQRQLDAMQRQLNEVAIAMAEDGRLRRRVQYPSTVEMMRCGQRRID